MTEYQTIYEKQNAVITAEISDHQRRIDVSDGAIKSLEEKQTTLKDAKETPETKNELAKIDSEIERHTKTIAVEKKVLAAIKEKKAANDKEKEDHSTECDKLRSKANIASAAVNDASTTLKNQREY